MSDSNIVLCNACVTVGPLSSYPTLEQPSQLECEQWPQLGVQLGLDNDTLQDTIKKSKHPTAETLKTAKINNIDIQWKDIVEAFVNIGEYKFVN